MPQGHDVAAVTRDHLLDGKVKYTQPRDGFRSALDPVLLAAAVPARSGDRVLEGGTGAGAALLCLAARVPGISGVGVDRDARLVALARANAADNRWPELWFVAADLAALPVVGPIDHAFANPPYHAASGTRSPSGARQSAMRGAPDLLHTWIEGMSRPLRHRGSLTFILPPRLLERCLKSMSEEDVAADLLYPIWPGNGRDCGLIVVRGRKHGRSPPRLASGLVLHTSSGAFRPEADAILRGGEALYPADGLNR